MIVRGKGERLASSGIRIEDATAKPIGKGRKKKRPIALPKKPR